MCISIDDYVPEIPEYVRGDCQYFLINLEPIDNGERTIFTVVSVIDPAGSIPTFVINQLVGKIVMFYVKLKRFIEDLK
jgi:hypothetical protein